MKRTVKAGLKEFLSAIMLIIISFAAGDIIGSAIPQFAAGGTVITILFGGVSVFYIYTRYCAQFTYILGEEGLTAAAKAGRRERRTYIGYADIGGIYNEKPKKKTAVCEKYIKTIFSRKNRLYIFSEKGARLLVIDADAEFTEKLKELCNA